MMAFSAILRSTAAKQSGLLSRSQLATHGIAAAELRRWKQRGWLVPFGTNVFRTAGSPVNDAMRLRAALLDAGPSAVLSHRTAANLHWFGAGVDKARPIDVTVPRGLHIVRPRTTIHEARDLIGTDIVSVQGLRTTSGARTLIDLAPSSTRSQLTRNADAAFAKNRTTTRSVYARIEVLRRPGRVGLARLIDVLADRPEGGVASVLEREFYDIVKVSDVPQPNTQIVFTAGGITVARVDAEFPCGLIVELLSRTWHTSPAAVKADSVRRRNLRLLGRQVIEFWADEVFSSPEFVLAELRRHLAIGGVPAHATLA